MKRVIEKLIKNNKTVSTMESCTGGGVVDAITNVEGASQVLKFSAVTYSNEFKIRMGVSAEVIDKYTVYSMETANEMSFNIAKFTDSNYGVGITGQINKKDPNNVTDEDDKIYISIYDRDNGKYVNEVVEAIDASREDNKKLIISKVEELLISIL